jgi:hypothetical protein
VVVKAVLLGESFSMPSVSRVQRSTADFRHILRPFFLHSEFQKKKKKKKKKKGEKKGISANFTHHMFFLPIPLALAFSSRIDFVHPTNNVSHTSSQKSFN